MQCARANDVHVSASGMRAVQWLQSIVRKPEAALKKSVLAGSFDFAQDDTFGSGAEMQA
jgi:hypothetical protein